MRSPNQIRALIVVLVACSVVTALARPDKHLLGPPPSDAEAGDKKLARFDGVDEGRLKRQRDLEDTQFLIEALKTLGGKDSDPNVQKALRFVSQSQNLKSPGNSISVEKSVGLDTTSVSKVGDGGH